MYCTWKWKQRTLHLWLRFSPAVFTHHYIATLRSYIYTVTSQFTEAKLYRSMLHVSQFWLVTTRFRNSLLVVTVTNTRFNGKLNTSFCSNGTKSIYFCVQIIPIVNILYDLNRYFGKLLKILDNSRGVLLDLAPHLNRLNIGRNTENWNVHRQLLWHKQNLLMRIYKHVVTTVRKWYIRLSKAIRKTTSFITEIINEISIYKTSCSYQHLRYCK